VNLQEILDPLDIFRKYTGIRMQDVYNILLQKGWTLGSAQMTVLMHGLIRLYHGGQVRLLKEFWKQGERDLVVSLVPNFNRALRDSLPATPLVTILTDLADYPPHFWIERQNQYLICGTGRAVEQALADLGGKLEAVYFTLGERDVLVLCDCPDIASVASLGLAASASGLVRTKITPLLTVEELDHTIAKGIAYRPPGA